MSKEYPLFPELSENGQVEAMALIEKFKDAIKKVADGVIGDLYTDVIPYIESDSWLNFKNDMMDGFKDYGNTKIHAEYNFKAIRKQIYKEYRDEIIVDLNQDLVEEIEKLKSHVKILQETRRY